MDGGRRDVAVDQVVLDRNVDNPVSRIRTLGVVGEGDRLDGRLVGSKGGGTRQVDRDLAGNRSVGRSGDAVAADVVAIEAIARLCVGKYDLGGVDGRAIVGYAGAGGDVHRRPLFGEAGGIVIGAIVDRCLVGQRDIDVVDGDVAITPVGGKGLELEDACRTKAFAVAQIVGQTIAEAVVARGGVECRQLMPAHPIVEGE